MGTQGTDLSIELALILFVYGLVFFAFGLVVALYSRKASRLALARSLKWLAAFGVLHGLNEWSELFILAYGKQLVPSTTIMVENIQLILLATSFAALMQFGISLVNPFTRLNWLFIIPSILCGGLLISMFFVFQPEPGRYLEWRRVSMALMRYGLCLPGALLAAFGLWREANRTVKPLNAPSIYKTLRIAGIGLLFYGLFAGLVVPPVDFFLGSWLNTITFQQTVGLPVIVFRSAVGVVLAITIIHALEIFDVETERLIEDMEQQQILATERERIGRDLHDGAIQKAYTAGLMVESSLRTMDEQSQASERLRPALGLIRDTINDLRQCLVNLHPTPAGDGLSSMLWQVSEEPRFRSLFTIQPILDFQEGEPKGAIRLHQIMAITSEALSNVARHARASKVILHGITRDGQFILTIEDNGVGLGEEVRLGFGLRNMRDRTRLLNGKLDLLGADPHGTIVRLTMPVRDDSE
jgi:signal transduction histidine kinase